MDWRKEEANINYAASKATLASRQHTVHHSISTTVEAMKCILGDNQINCHYRHYERGWNPAATDDINQTDASFSLISSNILKEPIHHCVTQWPQRVSPLYLIHGIDPN